MPSVLDILRPSVVRGFMQEIKTPYDRFQEFFGLGPKGPNCMSSETRSVSVDIVNDDRKVSTFSAPGSDPKVEAPQVIGTRQVTAPRSFSVIDLNYETLNNIRTIGSSASDLDRNGIQYIKHVSAGLMRKVRRFREFMILGALRGSCGFVQSGNDWLPVYTSPDITFDWQLAATHKNQLNGNISASWDTAGTEIITDLGNICAFAESESGLPIQHAWCNTYRWVKILNNTQVKAMGGTANVAFDEWKYIAQMMKSPDGTGTDVVKTEATGVLKGFPNIVWHITDRVLTLNGSTVKYLGNDDVIFHPEPSDDWIRGWEVKESTNQGYGKEPTDVYGFASWIKMPVDSHVPKYLLYGLDNFLPATNPNAYFFADVVP